MILTRLPNKGRTKVLVSTEWVADHIGDSHVRILESNEDPMLYSSGHISGALEIDWERDLNDPLVRDYIDPPSFEDMMSRMGIERDTFLVFYGDKNNWWACYSFWVFQLFGHSNAAVMDGGRKKWVLEGRELTKQYPIVPATRYRSPRRNDKAERAFREDVLLHLADKGSLVDVRSPEEYSGERLNMPGYPNEGALRGGHIPGAKNIPWAEAVNAEDGTFRSEEELTVIYQDQAGLSPSDDVITYCRIGERSSHTWFVLKHLLGWQNVRNYDGSWTEWGNAVGLPISR